MIHAAQDAPICIHLIRRHFGSSIKARASATRGTHAPQAQAEPRLRIANAQTSAMTSAIEDTTMILVVIVAIVAFASSSVGFMLGRCWPSMRHSKPAAKGRKDGEDMLIFHEKVQRKGIRTRNIMPACVLIAKHGEKYRTSAECKGLRGATSKRLGCRETAARGPSRPKGARAFEKLRREMRKKHIYIYIVI